MIMEVIEGGRGEGEERGAPRLAEVIDPINWQGKAVPRRRWLAEGIFPMNQPTMIGAHGGLGKTLLMLQLQVAASLGAKWLGFPVQHVKSIGFYAEDDADEIHRRLVDITRAEPCELADLEDMQIYSMAGEDCVLGVPAVQGGAVRPTALYDELTDKVKEFGAQLIIIDTVADVFGGNENIRSEVRSFVGLLRRLAMEIDGVVVLTAHPSKDGLNTGSGISGSTAWHNSVRSRLYLSKPEGEAEADANERTLETMKSNYGPMGEPITIMWRDGVFIRPPDDTGTIFDSIKKTRAEYVFLDCLDTLELQGRPVSPSPNARNFAVREMMQMPKATKLKQRDLRRAMENLFARREIEAVQYGRPSDNRHKIARTQNDGD